MSLRVIVIAPSLETYRALAAEIKRAGHLPVSTWDGGQENRVANLSTQQITELAAATLDLIIHVDAVVSYHDRLASGTSRGTSFFAGYAYALGLPVVVVGSYDEVALHSPRVIATSADNLRTALAQVEKIVEKAEKRFARAQIDGTVMLLASTPSTQTGDSHGDDSNNGGPADAPPAERVAGSETAGVVGGDGSHI